jgi:phosphatidylglycerophosphate synthase
VSVVADALGVLRLGVAAALPSALGRGAGSDGDWTPVVLIGVAAATDYLDGIVARRYGPTAHGAVLDNLADVAVVLAGVGGGVALDLVPAAAPAAIAIAFAAYMVASLRRQSGGLARSAVGHAAGVCNWALAGLVAGAVALPGRAWTSILAAGSLTVVGINLAAVLDRVVPRRRPTAA